MATKALIDQTLVKKQETTDAATSNPAIRAKHSPAKRPLAGREITPEKREILTQLRRQTPAINRSHPFVSSERSSSILRRSALRTVFRIIDNVGMHASPKASKVRMGMLATDRKLLQQALLAAALLLWPIMLFGAPAYFADSASYLKGGRTAVSVTVDRLQTLTADVSAPQQPERKAAAVALETAKGSRSVLYSLAAFVLSGPGASMIPLAVAQALATGWMVAIAAGLAGVRSRGGFGTVAAIVAFATPAALFACYIVPDIFAALLIASCVILTVAFERLSPGLRASLVAIGAFAVTSHASHPPVAGGLLLLGALWFVRQGPGAARRIAWLAAPLALGTLATIVTGFVGFGTLSLVPKRYPLTLARSIEDGPARWYLAEHCATRRYAVCEVFGPQMPETVPDFLWDKGLTGRATPEQMDRVRAEESEIVAAAAREYPVTQAKILGGNVASQVTHIGLGDISFDQRIAFDRQGAPRTVETGANRRAVLRLVEWLSAATALAGALWLAWAARRMRPCERAGAALLVAGLLGNAAVCAIFSGVADRYQARVVWLLPLLAVAMLIAAAERRSRADAG